MIVATEPDNGAQSERTGLAWQRTGLLGLFVAALAVRIAARDGGLAVAVALFALGSGLGLWSVGRHHDGRRPAATRRRTIHLAAGAVTVLGLGVLGLVCASAIV